MPMYEAELLDEERDAVQNLLNYLDSGKFSDRHILMWSVINVIQHFFWPIRFIGCFHQI